MNIAQRELPLYIPASVPYEWYDAYNVQKPLLGSFVILQYPPIGHSMSKAMIEFDFMLLSLRNSFQTFSTYRVNTLLMSSFVSPACISSIRRPTSSRRQTAAIFDRPEGSRPTALMLAT